MMASRNIRRMHNPARKCRQVYVYLSHTHGRMLELVGALLNVRSTLKELRDAGDALSFCEFLIETFLVMQMLQEEVNHEGLS